MSLEFVKPGIAVVTGGSSGVGRACSIALAHAGWQVVVSGRRQDQLEETIRLAKEGKSDIREMKAVAGDLSVAKDVEALFSVVEKEFGESSRAQQLLPADADGVPRYRTS